MNARQTPTVVARRVGTRAALWLPVIGAVLVAVGAVARPAAHRSLVEHSHMASRPTAGLPVLPALPAPAPRPALALPASAPVSPQTQAKVVAGYGQIPLHFEENRGQTDRRAEFLARGPGYTV